MTDKEKEAIEDIIDTSLKEKIRGVCTISVEYLENIKQYIQTQDKIIDLMATYIGKIDVSEDLCNDDICDEGNNCNKCIKKHFINKVEKENKDE